MAAVAAYDRPEARHATIRCTPELVRSVWASGTAWGSCCGFRKSRYYGFELSWITSSSQTQSHTYFLLSPIVVGIVVPQCACMVSGGVLGPCTGKKARARLLS